MVKETATIRSGNKSAGDEEAIQTYCPLSKSRCGVICYLKDGRFERMERDPGHPAGGLCIKGRVAPELVYHPERLKYPQRRSRPKGDPDPGWQRISWEEALETIVSQLTHIKRSFGPEAVAFGRGALGGSPAVDYSAWLTRLAYAFGSPNNLGTTHICNWHKDQCSKYTYGVGIPYPDYENSGCILVWGHNPNVSWPLQATHIGKARRGGAKLIVVDPRKIPLACKADIWLQVKPGTDGALALSLIHVLIAEGLFDETFVRDWTNGPCLVRSDNQRLLTEKDITAAGEADKPVIWDETAERAKSLTQASRPALFGKYLVPLADGGKLECKTALMLLAELAEQYRPETAEEITWVPANAIRQAAITLTSARPTCYTSYVGIEEHTNAAQTNRAICILYSLLGDFDAPGGNVIFPRIDTNPITGIEFLPPEKAKKRLGQGEKPLGPPATVGSVTAYDMYQAILTGKPYPVKGLVCLGSNPLLSNGDTGRGARALSQLDFYVHADLFENPTARFADILLPASSCFESEHLHTSFEMGADTCSYVQLRNRVIEPLYESWPDMKIIFELAKRLELEDKFFNGDLQAAFNYQLQPSGITLDEVRKRPGGIRVPIEVTYKKYAQARPAGFSTPSGKIDIYSPTLLEHGYDPLPGYEESRIAIKSQAELAREYPLVLTSAKLQQFCHTQHRNIPGLRSRVPHPFLEINPQKAKELEIADGEWVVLETAQARIRLKAKLTEGIDPRVVCTQHGWWQACRALELPELDPLSPAGSNYNLLISNNFTDPLSGSVPHRSYLCRVSKAVA
jgi:anaerobic selenocysteine-containing dehydrogenase